MLQCEVHSVEFDKGHILLFVSFVDYKFSLADD